MKTVLLLAAGATLCLAGETRSWVQSSYQEFQRGNLKNLTIRSDGRLSLAPKMSELFDSSTSYLWTLARDSKGNLYTAGGPGAKVFRIAANGKSEKVAEFDALEVHAIAIDSKDRVYAATAPDGKVFRIGANGKTEPFYDPKQKYIWSMICDPAGDLYIATGDQGEVHRVTPDGKGSVFFKTDETHARSLAFDRHGNLIVGTEPGGLVIRVTPKADQSSGEGFVLYQMPKPEVTALAIGSENEIYAAASGSKSASPAPAPKGTNNDPRPASGNLSLGQRPGPGAPSQLPPPVTVTGGADVYRIADDGSPERLWSGAQDIVYALALDANGKILIGAGNKGALYRVESRTLYSTLVSFPVAQVTALLASKDGAIEAATGNVGKLYRIGPDPESRGSIESDVFDTGGFSNWGRLSASGDLHGGAITLTARSGNLDRPSQNWSAWSQSVSGPEGGEVHVTPARFIQWRATLTGGATLDSVSAAYLRQNVAPQIGAIEATPPNYKFPAPSTPLTTNPSNLTLPPLGGTPSAPHVEAGAGGTWPVMTYAKGWVGLRWSASDENDDSLVYSLEIRGEHEKEWKPLRDKIYERYYSFDSTAFPDGDYRIRVTASDAPSNTPQEARQSKEISDPFTIDNAPPQITNLRVEGDSVHWRAADALSDIRKAEYSLDGGDWTVVDPVTKLSDSRTLDYSLTIPHLSAGEHTVAVRATDEYDNTQVQKLVFGGDISR